MKRTLSISLAILALISATPARAVEGGREDKGPKKLAKVQGNPVRTHFDINRLQTPIWTNGYCDDAMPNKVGDNGLVYPKGGGIHGIFLSGLLWGAQYDTGSASKYGIGKEIRVGGVDPKDYSSHLQCGKILATGIAESPQLTKNRIYRVRPNITPNTASADVSSEQSDGEGSADAIIAQYKKDWLEWPWQDGAPYYDVNGDKKYDPAIDIPGKKGADQTLWFVANDQVSGFTKSMGIEMQMTVWGYARTGALGNTYFRRYILINKGPRALDSMIVALWSDPDLGYSADDLVGCDTIRSLGFIYNGHEIDQTYAPLPPPAVGFDFLQGPLVAGKAGDSAIFLDNRVYGKRNMPMTAFFMYDMWSPDPSYFDPQNDKETYNNLKGLTKYGKQWVNPLTGAGSAFPCSGDPLTRTGWLDGSITFPMGDRRLGLSSGPFTFAPGDTQEVVLAVIAAGAIQGVDRLAAVSYLKYYDDAAQAAYDNFFDLPDAPRLPNVTATALDRAIILSWGDDPQAVAATENYSFKGYTFQGYNVYQLPLATSAVEEGKRLATFDIIDGVGSIRDREFSPAAGDVISVVKQHGTDSGIKRYFRFSTDALNNNYDLVNGTPYYVAVTSYNYNADPYAVPTTMENPIKVMTIVPHMPDPGVRYAGSYGDTIRPVIPTTASGGTPSDGVVIAQVVNPAKLTGHTYKVSFDTVLKNTVWKFADQTSGKVLLSNQTDQSGSEIYLPEDGITLRVAGPIPGWKDWQVPSGQRVWTDANGADAYGLEGFDPNGNGYGAVGMGVYWLTGSSVPPEKLKSVLIKFAACDGTWNPDAPPSDDNYSFAYRYMRGAQSAVAKPEFAAFIINKVNYGYQGFKKSVPFSAWDVDATPPRRLAVGHLENNVAAGMVDGKYWPPDYNVADNYATAGPREWFYIFAKDYSTTPDASLQLPIYDVNNLNSMPIMWWGTPARRGTINFSAADQFLILVNHANTPSNSFAFTTPQNTVGDATLAKDDIKQINVFPNPYYGVNPLELDKYQRFVTFSHLPPKAIIRIFNLGGVMVRKITRESTSQFERWDLKNEDGLPVGSGLYIVHIELPDLGVNKILKLAVVQEQQILDRY